jgi:hypothetical protein
MSIDLTMIIVPGVYMYVQMLAVVPAEKNDIKEKM